MGLVPSPALPLSLDRLERFKLFKAFNRFARPAEWQSLFDRARSNGFAYVQMISLFRDGLAS
jgi:hypothetical protein